MCFFGRDGKGAENHQRWGLRNEVWELGSSGAPAVVSGPQW